MTENNSFDDYIDEERRARRAQMREEKRRQAARREMIKKSAPYVVIGLIAAIVLIVAFVAGIRALISKAGARAEQKEKVQKEVEAIEKIEIPMPEEFIVIPEQKHNVDNMLEITVEKPNLFSGYTVDASKARNNITEEEVQSQYASLINATTGEVVVSRNGNSRMVPASMTKVMTVLVASEHISDLNDMFEVTLEDTDYAYIHDLSSAGFTAGEVVPVKDLLYGAIMPSGGECCHALERYVCDTEEEFIQLMNDKVQELGLTGTHFTNSAGLYNENHYTTLFDMSMIMKAAIENDICRQVLHEHMVVSQATPEHPEGIELSNWFMRRIEDKYTATEVMGAKTGYVVQSGNCAVSYTIADNGTVYIAATGNAHSAWRAIFDHKGMYEKFVASGVQN